MTDGDDFNTALENAIKQLSWDIEIAEEIYDEVKKIITENQEKSFKNKFQLMRYHQTSSQRSVAQTGATMADVIASERKRASLSED